LYNKGDGIYKDDIAETDSIQRAQEKCETSEGNM
jgi:hypothetical protein